nr:MAG TPA: hypothetical protein [Caudoviricetes sp.]
MRILPGGMDAPEDVEIANLETTIETLSKMVAKYKARIDELETTYLTEQKRNVG